MKLILKSLLVTFILLVLGTLLIISMLAIKWVAPLILFTVVVGIIFCCVYHMIYEMEKHSK